MPPIVSVMQEAESAGLFILQIEVNVFPFISGPVWWLLCSQMCWGWVKSPLHLYSVALSGCGQAIDFLCCVHGSPLHNVTFLVKMLKTDHLAS